jgi:hypothetical protein
MKQMPIMFLTFTFSLAAFSCIGGVKKINDDTVLTYDGIETIADQKHWSFDFIASKGYLGKSIPSYDSNKAKTHYVTILGAGSLKTTIGHKYYMSYLVRDLDTNEVKAYFLTKDEGARNISNEAVEKQDSNIRALERIGC